MITPTSLYAVSFLLASFGAWLLVIFGEKLNLYDIPNHRSSHRRAIPKGAGIGILSALLCVSFVLSIPNCIWVPALIISICSFWGGDKHKLSPKTRLIIQFGCSIYFLSGCALSNELGVWLYILFIALSIFIVGTSNFYNFMDGIDGIAGITGTIGFSLLGLFAYQKDAMEPYGVFCISLSLACIGFLLFNLPHAKVFLGDIGSVLLGFCFACMVIVLSDDIKDFIVMVGFLGTFYFDELFTMVSRIRNRDSLLKPHRKHIYQLLVNEFEFSHWVISIIYGLIQLSIGLLVIFVSQSLFNVLMVYFVFFSLLICLSMFITRRVVRS